MAIETANTFLPVREAFWLSEEWRKANLRYYPYYGRGYIQLTWDYNYRAVGERIGVELLDNPDAALEPVTAAKALSDYWRTRGIAAVAGQHNWREVRRLVQGGDAGLDRLVAICAALLN